MRQKCEEYSPGYLSDLGLIRKMEIWPGPHSFFFTAARNLKFITRNLLFRFKRKKYLGNSLKQMNNFLMKSVTLHCSTLSPTVKRISFDWATLEWVFLPKYWWDTT